MKRREIAVFYDGSLYTFRWLKALLWAKAEFQDLGVEISFLGPCKYLPFKFGRSSLSFTGRKFDALFIAHHHSHSHGVGGLPADELIEVVKHLKTQCNTLVWLDTADSTGTARFEIMPYVDLYLKKQLLVDRETYYRPVWGGRIYCEYYHLAYDLEDPTLSDAGYATLERKYLHKLKVSWNVGLADLFTQNRYVAYARPHTYTIPRFRSPTATRRIDVHFRGSAWPSTAGWQRTTTRKLLQRRADLSYPDLDSKVSYGRYIEEVQNSRTVVSPFGWGEVCTRDFEAFAAGASLLKPSVDHMETYPTWYEAGRTYIPIDWDFSNFDITLDGIRTKPEEYASIAQNAQQLYKNHLLGGDGKRAFANHILNNLGWL